MTGLIVQVLAAKAISRVQSITTITPVPADDLPLPSDDIFNYLVDAADQNDNNAYEVEKITSGLRLSDELLKHKIQQWRPTSNNETRIGYLNMFNSNNIVETIKGVTLPVHVLAWKHGAHQHNKTVMQETFMRWSPNADLKILPNAAHYPMKPPLIW